MKKYAHGIFLFHRDLRIQDNTGLRAAYENCEQLHLVFIATLEQLQNNSYSGPANKQFLVESLEDLSEQIQQHWGKLEIYQGSSLQILQNILQENSVDALFANKDYTPFAQQRDEGIMKLFVSYGSQVYLYDDALLHAPGTILKPDQTPYTVFTPFYRRALLREVNLVNQWKWNFILRPPLLPKSMCTAEKLISAPRQSWRWKWWTREAQVQLARLSQIPNYLTSRDYPALVEGTTGLSPYLKFGCISARQVWNLLNKCEKSSQEALRRELLWRDFFTHICAHFPHVLGHAFHEKYEHITWENDRSKFQAWQDGQTGFPIVDAGMRELKQTGWMHNRVRMITASFLVKNLHIDWRWGERYFAQHLLDYDPAVNNGNWQWAASTGCDAQPYFRIFNPWNQGRKFDPDANYIKIFVSELRDLSAQQIHSMETAPLHLPNYPDPIISHALTSTQAKLIYRQAWEIKPKPEKKSRYWQ